MYSDCTSLLNIHVKYQSHRREARRCDVIINVYIMLTRTQKDCGMYFLNVECKYL